MPSGAEVAPVEGATARSIAGSRRGRSPLWLVLVTLLVPLSLAQAQHALRASAGLADPRPEGPDFFVFAEETDYRMTDVFRVRGDGGGKVRLTHDKAATDPDLTPDGKRIVYTHGSGDSTECCGYEKRSIWVMGSDGSSPRPLVVGERDEEPAVSPDGHTLAFTRSTGAGGSWLHRVGMQGGEPVPVYRDPEAGALHGRPVWSPDGSRIAFHRISADRQSTMLLVVGSDGSDPRAVDGASPGGWFSWSPDGTRLVLTDTRSNRIELDVVDIETGTSETIHTGGWHPVWLSPSRIAFMELGPDSWDGHLALIDPATRATTVLPGGPHIRGHLGFSRLDAHCG